MELSEKIKKMPEFVQEAMASMESVEINGQIGKKYNLSGEEIGDMVGVIAYTILKDISLRNFPGVLKEKLRLSPSTAKIIALDIALKKFLPLRKHLVGIESLIASLGGKIPEVIPKPPVSETATPPPPPSPLPTPREPEEGFGIVHHKKALDIKSALKENSEIGKQLISKAPIKIKGFEEPVKPSIKNWIADYIQLLGSDWHSSVERSEYLFRSPNTQNLAEEERMTLGQILKSYDEDSPLPISPETGLLVLPEPRFTPPLQKAEQEERRNKLEEKEERPFVASLPRPTEVERAEPLKPTPIRPPEIHSPEIPHQPEEGGPKIKGNVIDLKENR